MFFSKRWYSLPDKFFSFLIFSFLSINLLVLPQEISGQVLTSSILDMRTKTHFHKNHKWQFHPGDSPIIEQTKQGKKNQNDRTKSQKQKFQWALPYLENNQGWLNNFHVQMSWTRVKNEQGGNYFSDFDSYNEKYKGYAWYRTSFRITSQDITDRFQSSNLRIRLGRIGQAEAVYLNGHFIGGTGLDENSPRYARINDDKLLYGKIRYYELPEKYLRLNRENVLAVRVFAKYDIDPGLARDKYYIASERHASRSQFWDNFKKITVIVLSVLLGLFYLYWQFLFRTEERATMYFALAMFAVALNTFMRSQIVYDIWPHGLWLKKIEFASFIAFVHLILIFVVRFSKLQTRLVRRLYLFWIGIGVVSVVTTLVFTNLYSAYQFISIWAAAPILVLFYLIYVMIMGRKIPAMGTVSIGILSLTIAIANDILLQFQFRIVTWEVSILDYGYAVLALSVGFSIVSNMVKSHEIIEKQAEEKKRLSRYFSPDVMETIIKENIPLGGEEKPIVTLFADIVGFTTFTETHDPQIVIARLNKLFESMAQMIFEHKATLDKFIGDSVMAFWGAPKSSGKDAYLAVSCALRMQEANQRINDSVEKEDEKFLLRIGLNLGASIVGNVGSELRMDYTVIGDAVNLASRIESHSVPGGVTISESVFEAAGGADVIEYKEKRTIHVKGKALPIIVYDVTGIK